MHVTLIEGRLIKKDRRIREMGAFISGGKETRI
jgi:hypothetical protein